MDRAAELHAIEEEEAERYSRMSSGNSACVNPNNSKVGALQQIRDEMVVTNVADEWYQEMRQEAMSEVLYAAVMEGAVLQAASDSASILTTREAAATAQHASPPATPPRRAPSMQTLEEEEATRRTPEASASLASELSDLGVPGVSRPSTADVVGQPTATTAEEGEAPSGEVEAAEAPSVEVEAADAPSGEVEAPSTAAALSPVKEASGAGDHVVSAFGPTSELLEAEASLGNLNLQAVHSLEGTLETVFCDLEEDVSLEGGLGDEWGAAVPTARSPPSSSTWVVLPEADYQGLDSAMDTAFHLSPSQGGAHATRGRGGSGGPPTFDLDRLSSSPPPSDIEYAHGFALGASAPPTPKAVRRLSRAIEDANAYMVESASALEDSLFPEPFPGGEQTVEVEGTSLEGGGGQGREEFHVSITVSTDERTSWGGMLEAQVGALQMEEPPQLVESEAERASAASLPAPHRADAATLLRELPPTRAGIRMRTEGQGGWEPFGGRLDSRLGPRTSKPASRGGNQSSSSGGPLFSAGTSVGAWLESWDSASASTSDRRPRTAQEVFELGPTKRHARRAVMTRPAWNSNPLRILPKRSQIPTMVGSDPVSRRNFRPSFNHPRHGRQALLRHTIADRIQQQVDESLEEFKQDPAVWPKRANPHPDQWPIRVGDQHNPLEAPHRSPYLQSGELAHCYKEDAFYQSIVSELKKRSSMEVYRRRLASVATADPTGFQDGRPSTAPAYHSGGDYDLPYISPQVAVEVEKLQKRNKTPKAKANVGSWIYLLGNNASSLLARELAVSTRARDLYEGNEG